jgi:hypothetical protein
MSRWCAIPKPIMTKEFRRQTDVQVDIIHTRITDLVGLSSVAVDMAPTQAVWRATAPATCQRWYPIFLLNATIVPPTKFGQHVVLLVQF